MYAYKDELKNGFASNKNLCLWRRDGARLIRKYFRVKNSDDIFYISNIYRPWPDHEDNYLELNVVCSEIGDKMGHVVKLCDLDQVEAIIVEGNYAALNLAPYVFYRRKVEGESFNERADSQDITQSSKKLVEATVTHQDNSAKQDDEMEVEEIQDEDGTF